MDHSSISFSKMHGLGNDFVVLDSRVTGVRTTPEMARAVGDRNRGVGFDQLAEITTSDNADVHLTFWNSDGTTAGACGNATRCVAQRLFYETGKREVSIETSRGILLARLTDEGPSVNMGMPQLTWQEIPLARDVDLNNLPLEGAPSAVGMGNPHAVYFVENAEETDPSDLGPTVEVDPLFPQGTNVEFVTPLSRTEARMRVWERGAGITMACGSGACASLVAAHRRGLMDRKAVLHLDGGSLLLDWQEDGVWMTGATAHVFDATFTADFLSNL